MKKIFLFVVLLFTFISCQDEVKFNNPSFQGMKDNVFWRAIDSKATLTSNGSLVIEAYTTHENVTLKMPAPTALVNQNDTSSSVTYPLGATNTTTATYVLKDSNGSATFSTGLGIGNGQIVITDYDLTNKTISGTFKFNAENTSTNPTAVSVLNFQYGVFYKIPL